MNLHLFVNPLANVLVNSKHQHLPGKFLATVESPARGPKFSANAQLPRQNSTYARNILEDRASIAYRYRRTFGVLLKSILHTNRFRYFSNYPLVIPPNLNESNTLSFFNIPPALKKTFSYKIVGQINLKLKKCLNAKNTDNLVLRTLDSRISVPGLKVGAKPQGIGRGMLVLGTD